MAVQKLLLLNRTFDAMDSKSVLVANRSNCKKIITYTDAGWGCGESGGWRWIAVVLLFYVHAKHLRSFRDGQLT